MFEGVRTRFRRTPTRRREASERGLHRRAVPSDRAKTVSAENVARAEFGGMNVGAAFFGWLVAIGFGVILTGLAAAAGAAIGLTDVSGAEAGAVSVGGAVALFLIGLVAYFAGGYVAGRMSRFDGGWQGFGVWMFGLMMTVVLAVVGAVAGGEYNVFSQLNLPRIPVEEGSLTSGAAITLAAITLGTFIAAILGGKAGERYHARIDEIVT